MNNKKVNLAIYTILYAIIFGLLFLNFYVLSGCGQQSSSTTTTTIAPGATIAISGSLRSSSLPLSAALGARGIRAMARSSAALNDYNVVAVSKDTGNIYFASAATDASGNFTVPNLPASESYYLEILDSSNKLVAPIAFGTNEGKAIMAVESTSNLNLGQIAYSSTDHAAAPVSAPSSNFDLGTSVEAKTGEPLIPKGAGNFGKGSETEIVSSTYNAGVADGDKDGLPNMFDADNNGDLVVDELDGMYTKEVFSVIAPPNFVTYAFTNLKVDFDNRNTYNTNYSDFTLAVGITDSNAIGKGSGTKTISSARVLSGPSWISTAKISDTSNLWSSTNYNIPRISTGVYEVQLNNLKPITNVTAGDMLKYLITYNDGSTEEAVKMINFVFTEIPSASAYSLNKGVTWHNITASSGPIGTATTSEVYFRWSRPKDENGTEIKGGRYTFEYNAVGGGASEIEVINKDTSSASYLEAGYNLGSLSNANFSGSEFLVGLCIRSIANDNSAENMRFVKGW